MRVAGRPILIAVLGAVLPVTACGPYTGSSAANRPAAGAFPGVRAGGVSVYVTQANGAADGIVYGYAAGNKANRVPACTIAGQKFDHSQIAVDASGNTYSPNLEASTINIYAPHCGTLSASVKDPYGADLDVALGDGGTFYGVGGRHVSICTTGGCTGQLTDSSIFQLETAAVDASGNVWASYYNQKGAPSLIIWPGGSMPGKTVNGYVNQNTPGDLAFDRSGNLLALQTLFPRVYIYQCDASAATCTNTKIVALRSGSLYGALNASNTDFQATDYEGNAVDVYSYPSFTFRYTYNRGLKQGYSAQGIAQTL